MRELSARFPPVFASGKSTAGNRGDQYGRPHRSYRPTHAYGSSPVRLFQLPNKRAPVSKLPTKAVEDMAASRSKSAMLSRREKIATPKRDVQSACEVRQTPAPAEVMPSVHTPSSYSPEGYRHNDRTSSPSPEEFEQRYQESLRIHGWRAEVHGSPLKPVYKGPKISTEVKSLIARKPPPFQFHFRNDNTYFYHTIPPKLNSYVIHPNFFSERIAERQIAHYKKPIEYVWA
ncbi:uncharacterized protein LOC106168568 [Lingula anatina]|uniref:Uncharacterized protein LOC106168568 n=1 Tax=Lingula anatina TaxID=7574 RepID=A0A1S3IYT0_LINAN|nr:uncharacterized protein LOC106168568 [Lingula anatina]XP_013403141.1 uncharacterized protein LOC106168568 [Lingula anatina]|eukprot:XP_013403140.1 uncharacterized protein LOC106168568 [Lingula anatina]